jgi:hypothetical protein
VLPGPTALTVIRRAANSTAATPVTWLRPEYSAMLASAVLVTPEQRSPASLLPDAAR